MSKQRVPLFRLHRARFFAGPGVVVLAVLILLSLRFGLFPFWYESPSPTTYWIMAIAGTLGMFASLVLHDLSHWFAEKRLGGRPGSVQLYMFGDVSLGDEPAKRKIEWKVAYAGPIFSLLLGLALLGLSIAIDMGGFPQPLVGVLFHLAAANLTLAFFNFLPFYPLDGGRVLRAMLWQKEKSFVRANHLATRGGLILSGILVFSGALLVVYRQPLVGGWLVAFGVSLGFAAQLSRESVMLRQLLKGRKIREMMNPYPVCVTPLMSLEGLARDFVDKYDFDTFPVLRDLELVGLVSEKDLRRVSRDCWPSHKVSEVVRPISEDNTVTPETTATQALDLMKDSGLTTLLVAERGRLLGIVTTEDLWTFAMNRYENSAEKAA